MPGRSRHNGQCPIKSLEEEDKDPKPKRKDYLTDRLKYGPDPWKDIVFREIPTTKMYVKCPRSCKDPFLVVSWVVIEPNLYKQKWVQEVRITLSSNEVGSKDSKCGYDECKEGKYNLLPEENSWEKVRITCPKCFHIVKLDKVAKEVPDMEQAVLPFDWATEIPRVRVGLVS